MNTFIVNRDLYKSADMLDQRRLFSSIYEGIHGLASIMGVSDKLVTPKKPKPNHPCALQYVHYKWYWLRMLDVYYRVWYSKFANKDKWTKDGTINAKNLSMLYNEWKDKRLPINLVPVWLDDAIEIHRNVLWQKDPEFYSDWASDKELEMKYFL
jgi:hypothetical protein